MLGKIAGNLAPAGVVKSIKCLDRGYNMSYRVRWSKTTGRFLANGLAPDRRYDLEVFTTDGKRFIGVDLTYEEDPLLRLARRQAPDAGEPGPLTDNDRGQINDIVTKIETFEDQRRIMALRGHHQRASALVELRRTRPFHSGKRGEHIRRVEIWYFKFQHGGWEKIANAEKVLSRVRAGAEQIDRQAKREIYLPKLGGILVDASGKAPIVELNLPGYKVEPPASRPDAK